MSVMPGPPFPQVLPPLTPIQKAEIERKVSRKRNIALAAEVGGLMILSSGLALWALWVGIVALGLGVLLIGIGIELSA